MKVELPKPTQIILIPETELERYILRDIWTNSDIRIGYTLASQGLCELDFNAFPRKAPKESV